jgi:D-alanyl-D-alanine carboxypeptidase/D-alanyl-D-alanine-endopeptidase (penicillin-binding protein 4)
MTDVLNRICKNSNNLFADALCKYQGRAMELSAGHDVPGSWSNGSDAVHAFLKKNKIDDSKFVIVDGSGLARANRVTTRLISDELVVMHRHRYHDAFFNALPIGGKDGTIAKRMTDLQGHVFAKTGYIGGVRSLSGYVKTKEGKWLVFSIIFNKLPGSVAPAEDIQDNVCRVLVESPKIENAQIKPVRPATTQSSD